MFRPPKNTRDSFHSVLCRRFVADDHLSDK